MPSDLAIQIALTPRFKNELRTLANIRSDLQVLIDQLQVSETLGDRIVGMSDRLHDDSVSSG